MLKKLLRPFTQPKWQHDDANIRLQAVEQLGAADENILKTLVLNDKDGRVRDKALSKISSLPTLLQLSAETRLAETALKHWAQRISDTQYTSAFDAEQIITACSDALQLSAIISHSANSNLVELALAGLSDESQLLELMNNSKSSRLWLQAINKIHSEAGLKKASTIVKGRDKGALQQVKQKLESLAKAQAAQQKISDAHSRLQDKAAQLQNSASVVHLQGEILNLQQQWQTLLEDDKDQLITAADKQVFEQHLAALTTQHQQQLQQQAEEQANIEQQQQASAETSIAQTLKQQLQQHSFDKDMLQQSQQQLNQLAPLAQTGLEKQLQQLLDFNAQLQQSNIQSLNDEKRIQALTAKPLQQQLDLCSQLLQQGKKLGIAEQTLSQIKTPLSALQKHQQSQQQDAKQSQQQLTQLLADTEELLDENAIDQAKSNLKAIKSCSDALNKQQLQPHQAALSRIHKRLHALDDWKNYSTNPKREALIAQMQALTTETLTAEIRLAKIKDLQQEWKTLGHCQEQQLWKTFQQASDEAYAPCQENFAEQRNLRKFNAQQRTTICEQLEGFIQQQDFSSAAMDWKNIEKLNRDIINEWKKFTPVEPKAHKALQKRFSESFDAINTALQQQQINTEQQLEELCTQAEALQTGEDARAATQDFQQLMQQWKQINQQGISRRKQQQSLWTRFKQAGDTLHTQKQSQHQAAEQQIQDNAKQAQRIIEQLEELALTISQKTHDDIGPQQQEQAQLRQDFSALGNLPNNQFKALKNGFDSACENIEQARQQASKNSWIQQLQQLVDFGSQCSEREIADADAVPSSLLPESFSTAWKEALAARFSPRLSADDYQQQARTLCIEMEKLCDVETPSEDAALKMELQMQQLANNFGQQQQLSFNQQLEALYLRWFALPCWDNALHTVLQQRFLKACTN